MKNTDTLKKDWSNRFAPLKGRKITGVRWMDKGEVEHLGWYSAPIVLQLDDGTILWPSRDDEGNDAGALFVQQPENINPKLKVPDTAPVIG